MMIPVVIAFTPSYFVPAAVMLRSLLDSSDAGASFRVICLVSEDIPSRMKEKLSRMGGGRMEFDYVALGGCLSGIYTDPRYSEAASFRLLLPELLPHEEKVLYLDCDIILRQDAARLFSRTDLGDSYLAAVHEAPIEGQAARISALGCVPGEYFNSGVLLMNLALMRADGLVDKFLEASRVEWLEFPDQDVLNQVCKGRVLPLSPLFNGIRTFFLPQYRQDFARCYPSVPWDEVQDGANIHYTGGKPWTLLTVKFGEWWRTYERLPLEIRQEWTPDRRAERLWKIYRTGAGRMAIEGARSLYRRIKH